MNKSILQIFLALVISNSQLQAQQLEAFFTKANSFFGMHVTDGKVDYKAIHANSTSLDQLLVLAKNAAPNEEDKLSFQAFWINAYNLAVIKGIVANYPINSPLDQSGFFDKTTYNLAGLAITLNDIENKMLRAKFNDPRVHFVLVCGALGCPPIINKAYLPTTLENQLESQTIMAINNPDFIRVKGKKVQVSEIFKWYNQDFETNKSTLVGFINRYKKEPLVDNSKISYYSYNWNLNGK